MHHCISLCYSASVNKTVCESKWICGRFFDSLRHNHEDLQSVHEKLLKVYKVLIGAVSCVIM